MSKVVILGAGISGHVAAAHLRRKLLKEHEVLLVARGHGGTRKVN